MDCAGCVVKFKFCRQKLQQMQGGARKKREVLFRMDNMEHFNDKTSDANKKLICKFICESGNSCLFNHNFVI